MNDIEWARDLFDRSHGGPEPAWVADHVELARLGRRRSRVRALTASGGGVAVVAAAAVAAVGITGGPVSKPVPVATKPRHVQPADPHKIFQYFSAWGENQPAADADPAKNGPRDVISLSAATALASLVDRLDPTHAHLHSSSTAADAAVVADSDPIVTAYTTMSATSQWTADGKVVGENAAASEPSGTLSIRFLNSGADLAYDPSGCGGKLNGVYGLLDPTSVAGQPQVMTDGAKWTPCAKSELGDGSMLLSMSKSYKDYSIYVVTRSFPGDTGVVAVTWSNYRVSLPSSGFAMMAPDPKSVLTPEPFTEAQLADAMSGPTIVSALTPAPVVAAPANLLQPSDLGSGWTFDAAQSHATTGDLVVDNGCVNEQNPVAKVNPVAVFHGTTPSGQQVRATAEIYSMAAGKGPSWMTELRKYGTGGCDQGPNNSLKYSEDSMTALPSGIGDDAFIENWYGQGSYTFMIRFKDDIIRVDVTKPDSSMPIFTQADQTWFAGLAEKAAARYVGAKS